MYIYISVSVFSFVIVGVSFLLWKKKTKKSSSDTCHFCGKRQEVDVVNRWYCKYCNQYNGFEEDGDYNVDRPEFYVEELNPSSFCEKGRMNNSNSLFCDRCLAKQEAWLHNGREKEETLGLCSNCAFEASEVIKKKNVDIKVGYLGSTVKRSRLNIAKPSVSMKGTIRVPFVMLYLIVLWTLILSVMSSVIGSLWFYDNEFVVYCSCVLFGSLCSMLSYGLYSYTALVVFLVSKYLSFPQLGVFGVTAALYSMGKTEASWINLGAKKFSEPLKHLEKEAEIKVDDQENAEDEFELGVNGKGWSNRKAAFEWSSGEREPGSLIVSDKVVTKVPSKDELFVESMMNKVSISKGVAEEMVPDLIKKKIGSGAFLRMRLSLALIVLSTVVRLFFYERVWGIYMYISFLTMAITAIQVEGEDATLKAYYTLALGSLVLIAFGYTVIQMALSLILKHLELIFLAVILSFSAFSLVSKCRAKR